VTFAGAVALSTGNAIGGATDVNSSYIWFSTPAHSPDLDLYSYPVSEDPHLQSVSQAGLGLANQNLFDLSALEFDLTPAVSGPLVFSYVLGSEEYSEQQQGAPIGPPGIQTSTMCHWGLRCAHPAATQAACVSA
jgi:hypothetical protein